MRVTTQTALTPAAAPASGARGAASAAFALSAAEEPRAPPASAGPRSVAGIDALIALQAVEGPGERRRRAVARGRKTLDALDALKLGVIAGTLDPMALRALQAAAENPEDSGDPGLDAVLAEITLRAAVEVAKFASPGRPR